MSTLAKNYRIDYQYIGFKICLITSFAFIKCLTKYSFKKVLTLETDEMLFDNLSLGDNKIILEDIYF